MPDLVALLPHRPPMLFLDVAEQAEPGVLVARQTVPTSGEMIAGHFPGFAVWPGALLLEAMAQTTAILLLNQRGPLEQDEVPVLGAVEGRFLRPVFPGETVEYRCEMVRRMGELALFSVTARRDGTIVARAKISSGIQRRRRLGG